MNAFESALLSALLGTAESALPIFVKSPSAIAIANVSEEFLLLFTQGLAGKSPVATTIGIPPLGGTAAPKLVWEMPGQGGALGGATSALGTK